MSESSCCPERNRVCRRIRRQTLLRRLGTAINARPVLRGPELQERGCVSFAR